MSSESSALFYSYGTVKDTPGQMRHADPSKTLRYYG
jgi:hypothetical protein